MPPTLRQLAAITSLAFGYADAFSFRRTIELMLT
jgi:hypothetical protein